MYVNGRDAGMSAAYFRQNRSAAATRRARYRRTPACRHESRSAHPCNRWRFFAAVAKIRVNAALATGRTVADFVGVAMPVVVVDGCRCCTVIVLNRIVLRERKALEAIKRRCIYGQDSLRFFCQLVNLSKYPLGSWMRNSICSSAIPSTR